MQHPGSRSNIGINRRKRENNLSESDYKKIKITLLADVRDAIVLQITPSIVSKSIILLENNVLRTLDAFHIDCALEWNADLFVTSDKRQIHAAKQSGLKTKYLGV